MTPGRASQAFPAPTEPRWALGACEVALTAVTVAAVVGLARVFADASFLVPVLSFALAGHALAALCRRTRRSAAVTSAVELVVLVAAASIVLLPESTWFGIPTGSTWALAGEQLGTALATFRAVVAPAPVEPGFVLAAAIIVWLLAFVADTAAFRAGASIEAAVPGVTLFVFGAALGSPRHRLASTGLFLVALLAYWLAQRVLAHGRSANLMTVDAGSGPRALARSGAVLGAAAVVVAMVVGPNLPGASASPVVPWQSADRTGPDSRVTLSPLVDIRAQLVDQSDVEVFTVASPARSYWRLTSLEIFDGRIWSSRGQYRKVDGSLPSAVDVTAARATSVAQQFDIGALASIWLPAAYAPVAVQGVQARYDADSGSLLTEAETASGLAYSVTSQLRDLSADELAGVPNLAPAEVAETYTALPDGFSDAVVAEAARVVGDAPTQYDRARRLQDHFRSGAFAYDLAVPAGHAGDDLERFLFETRRGYCEQFAGAYAAMARAVGLPARVAVGFTPGEPAGDGRYVVRGLNAHAWPEVFLAGYGWVAFEPTPGRGIPRGEGYTGVPEQQASAADPTTATTVAPAEPAASDAGPESAGPPPTTGDPVPGPERGGAPATMPAPSWALRLAFAALVGIGTAGVWAGALALLRRSRRLRRRSAAVSTSDRVLVAWAEVSEALARAGLPPRPAETPLEFARRASGATELDARVLHAVAGVATAAGYGPSEIGGHVAEQATRAADDLERRISGTLDRRTRWLAAVDPRPLLPRRAPRFDISSRSLSPLPPAGDR